MSQFYISIWYSKTKSYTYYLPGILGKNLIMFNTTIWIFYEYFHGILYNKLWINKRSLHYLYVLVKTCGVPNIKNVMRNLTLNPGDRARCVSKFKEIYNLIYIWSRLYLVPKSIFGNPLNIHTYLNWILSFQSLLNKYICCLFIYNYKL